jgi:hypothetical protein
MTHHSAKTTLRSTAGKITRLSRVIRAQGLSKTERALLGHDLRQILGLTAAEAAALCGVSVAYINLVGRLSPEQRDAVRGGKARLSSFANGRKPSRQTIERFITRVGPGVIFDVLDQITRPEAAPVINGNGAPPFDPPFSYIFGNGQDQAT